jgi:antitoxin (DNA-binding transcriptional repressor) of toxin-antitoxin stability system
MSETVRTFEDAARCLPDLVERIHARGEAALLVKSGQPLARIVPVPGEGQVTEDLLVFLRRWRTEHPEPDEQFAEAIEESRKAIRPPHDPWRSYWTLSAWLRSSGAVSVWNDCSRVIHGPRSRPSPPQKS